MSVSTVGFIDIGSNTCRLIVVRFTDIDEIILEDSDVLPIGRCLYSEGKVEPEIIEESRRILSVLTERARNVGASRIIAFATCAFRDSHGDMGLEDAIPEGVELRIISGEEEASLTRLGVFGTEPLDKKTLLIDIGGGSTEFSISYGHDVLMSESLPIGAVRFSYGSSHDPKLPYSEKDCEEVRARTREIMAGCTERIRGVGFEKVVGCSGSFKTIKRILDILGLPVNLDSVSMLLPKIIGLTVEERAKVPGLGSKRADIMTASAIIAETILKDLGITEFDVSQKGLKDGMFIRYRSENL